MVNSPKPLRVAIACGGTGGHLFPGMAVGEELGLRGWEVTLLVSAKDVDQQVVRATPHVQVVTLPAVGLQGGNKAAFMMASLRSRREAQRAFLKEPPDMVLGMGGFTSAPPVIAGRAMGALTFLHESNTIPGRANRWLAHVVDECFVGFPEAASRLWHPKVLHTGTPVRTRFERSEPEGSRLMLQLATDRPVLAIIGGSQGAVGLNRLVLDALPLLKERVPELQFAHLTGPSDVEAVREAYARAGVRAWVRPFFSEMELLLNAATAVVARAGASSLAELAAMGLPAVLVPYPVAADDHQRFNARAIVAADGARMVEQSDTPEMMAAAVIPMLLDPAVQKSMSSAMSALHTPDAARRIADRMELVGRAHGRRMSEPLPGVFGDDDEFSGYNQNSHSRSQRGDFA